MSAPAAAADLFETLVAIGAEVDHHESDLYVRATSAAVEAVKASGLSHSFFRSAQDGGIWIEVPFAYAPFWRKRGRQ